MNAPAELKPPSLAAHQVFSEVVQLATSGRAVLSEALNSGDSEHCASLILAAESLFAACGLLAQLGRVACAEGKPCDPVELHVWLGVPAAISNAAAAGGIKP